MLNIGSIKDQTGRDVIRIRARVTQHQGKSELEVTADFLPSWNYMPSRVVYHFLPDGGVLSVTDIEYQQVSSEGVWFPTKIAQRCFPRNTTSDPDATTGQNMTIQTTMQALMIGDRVQDEDFDPILPAKTLLRGNLCKESSTGDSPVRASKMTRSTPLTMPDTPSLGQGSNARASSWPFAAGFDFFLLGFCVLYRRRLAF